MGPSLDEERDARAEPFLSGMFTRGEVVYAGSEAEAAHDREPVAIFTGEVLPLYAARRGDPEQLVRGQSYH
jgi:hypothetical protein